MWAKLISVNTVRLGEHLPLLDLLPTDSPIAWVRGGDGLVGWGVHASIKVSGANRFNDARTWWHQQLETFSVADAVHASGTGPILFTSFAFSALEESVLVIPKVIVGQRNGKSWLTWIGDVAQPILPTEPSASTAPKLTWQSEPISESDWEAQVSKLVREIQGGNVDKVVLARDQSAKADREIDVRNVLRNLAREYPSTWNFAVAGLVGATPELLLRLNKGMVTSRVLAGTISKTGDDERDLALAGSLARSSKDLEEHNYAVRSVADALEPFCSSTNVPESPFVLHLSNVMHLATDVTGALAETTKQVDSFSLLEKLHPSAAVCGTPTDKAFELITAHEGINRGRYAGPVGWIDAAGDGELGIALRCGQITGSEIRIFAGCGIVNGSIPAKELAESEAKFAPMRNALN
jgi:menaquinone-specific isochorismate synthase